MSDGSPHYLLPLVLAGLLVGLAVGCDSSGGNDGGDDPSTAALWAGTYDGTGQEVDFQGILTNETNIQPSLGIGFERDTTLDVVQLSWNEGRAVIPTRGPLKTLTTDSLVTETDTAMIQDTVQTWFRFHLARAGADSGRVESVEGTLRQFYEDAFTLDSTIVTFSVTRN